jgi:hypothetical protein
MKRKIRKLVRNCSKCGRFTDYFEIVDCVTLLCPVCLALEIFGGEIVYDELDGVCSEKRGLGDDEGEEKRSAKEGFLR